LKARILIALIIACVSTLAIAAGASASQLKAESYPAVVTGASSGDFAIDMEGSMDTTCAQVDLSGELSAAQEFLTVNPVFTGGCIFGGVIVPIVLNGCDWGFGFGAGGGDEFAGTLGIYCPAGQAISLSWPQANCEIQIPGQIGLAPVSFENLTAATPKEQVAADVEVTGLVYRKTKDGIFCPLNGLGSMSDGVLTVSVTLAGKVKGSSTPLGIRVE